MNIGNCTFKIRKVWGYLNIILIALFILGLEAGGLTANAIECGDTIGPDTAVKLTHDLQCEGDVALTVVGPAVLNLKGHSISRTGPGKGVGILVTGKNAKIRNGTVVGFYDGVVVSGEGNHKIRKVNAMESWHYGFSVESDANKLAYTIAEANRNGFYVSGNKNKLHRNTAINNYMEGIFVAGDRNVIVGNTATGNRRESIEIDGNQNRVVYNTLQDIQIDGDQNRVARNTVDSIEIDGNENRVARNTVSIALDEGIMIDGDDNIVRKNTDTEKGSDGIKVSGKCNKPKNKFKRIKQKYTHWQH
jgi:parallel beta-helix repeat protein